VAGVLYVSLNMKTLKSLLTLLITLAGMVTAQADTTKVNEEVYHCKIANLDTGKTTIIVRDKKASLNGTTFNYTVLENTSEGLIIVRTESGEITLEDYSGYEYGAAIYILNKKSSTVCFSFLSTYEPVENIKVGSFKKQ
jgi:hypothetical protein